MSHGVGLGLFEEIGLLRGYLREARCLHGVKLKHPCFADCQREAREALRAEAGAAAIAEIKKICAETNVKNQPPVELCRSAT